MNKVTNEMIAYWIGGDNLSVDKLLTLMSEFANGEYSINEFKADVQQMWKESEQ